MWCLEWTFHSKKYWRTQQLYVCMSSSSKGSFARAVIMPWIEERPDYNCAGVVLFNHWLKNRNTGYLQKWFGLYVFCLPFVSLRSMFVHRRASSLARKRVRRVAKKMIFLNCDIILKISMGNVHFAFAHTLVSVFVNLLQLKKFVPMLT